MLNRNTFGAGPRSARVSRPRRAIGVIGAGLLTPPKGPTEGLLPSAKVSPSTAKSATPGDTQVCA